MTKNKTLAIILSVLFVFALVIALGQGVFRVGKIELQAHTTTNYLSSLNEEIVLENSQLNKGRSVFLLNRDEYSKNLEAQQPYIKVLSIEVVWPNTVKFHYSERQELYCVALDDGRFAYLDADFKVLKLVETAFSSNQQNPILIAPNAPIVSESVVAGMFLDKSLFSDSVNLYAAYDAMGYSVSQMKSMVKQIYTQETENGHTLVMETFLGVKIQILNSAYYTEGKVGLAYERMEKLDASQCSKGTIYVFKNKLSVLESLYIE